MTTELARMEGNAIEVLDGANDALARLGAWVEAARNAHQLVAPLVGTAFVPDAYKPKVDPRATPEEKAEARATAIANATAAVLQGITLGLDPMTALQQIYVVHGRPGMYAKIKVALVQSKGHEVWTEDLSDTRAVVCGRRKGSTFVERITVTMDQARKAGWTRNDNYTKTPQDMLYARAASRVCDRVAPDALMGIASVEEIHDEMTPASNGGSRTVTPRKRATPRLVATVEPAEPPLDDAPYTGPAAVESAPEPELDEPAAEVFDPITAPQQKKLHAVLGKLGLADRERGLAAIAAILDRDVESTKHLSKQDAKRVIDALEAEEPAEPALDDEWPDTPTIPGTE